MFRRQSGSPPDRALTVAWESIVRIGIVSVFVDYHRNGHHHRGVLQPQIGALICQARAARRRDRCHQ
jgi:hypothetical protein